MWLYLKKIHLKKKTTKFKTCQTQKRQIKKTKNKRQICNPKNKLKFVNFAPQNKNLEIKFSTQTLLQINILWCLLKILILCQTKLLLKTTTASSDTGSIFRRHRTGEETNSFVNLYSISLKIEQDHVASVFLTRKGWFVGI